VLQGKYYEDAKAFALLQQEHQKTQRLIQVRKEKRRQKCSQVSTVV
jgi:hypothetical protein